MDRASTHNYKHKMRIVRNIWIIIPSCSIWFICFSGIIWAVTPCSPTPSLESFLCQAHDEYHKLWLLGKVEILLNTSSSDLKEIIEEAKKRIKPFLTKAKNSVFFNTRAAEALDDFYVYWITCVDNVYPYTSEDLMAYQKRSSERYFILQEKANRLKIALE